MQFKQELQCFLIMSTLDLAVQRFKTLKEKLNRMTSCEKGHCYQVKKVQSVPEQPPYKSKNTRNQGKVSVSQTIKNPKGLECSRKGIHSRGKSDQSAFTGRQNKENQHSNLNKYSSQKVYSKKTDLKTLGIKIIEIEEQNPTQKKSKPKNTHNRNKSDNLQSFNSKSTQLEGKSKEESEWRLNTRNMSSLQHSRASGYEKQLTEKEKTLEEINMLLDKKKQILEGMEKKIQSSRVVLFQAKDENMFSGCEIANQNLSRKKLKAPNLFQMQMEARRRGNSKSMKIHWK